MLVRHDRGLATKKIHAILRKPTLDPLLTRIWILLKMRDIFPDATWYSRQSERKKLSGRCPYASIHRCPRNFESVALLSDTGTTSRMPQDLHDAVLEKWKQHDLTPSIAESGASISGGNIPNCYSNFCPETSFDTFGLFATTLIRLTDSIDRNNVEQLIKADPRPTGRDWRWTWSHVSPLHYSDCAMYSLLHQEKPMANLTFNAPVTGNVNIAGHTISSPTMSLTISELIEKIDASTASPQEKEEAKSKLGEFFAHPTVASVVGGIFGGIVG